MDRSTIARKRKSEPLNEVELAALKAYRAEFSTEVDCAVSIGIDRVVLGRVILVGSGSPVTIKKVRKALKKASDRREEEKATA